MENDRTSHGFVAGDGEVRWVSMIGVQAQPPLRSGFVGRQYATSEKRSPIKLLVTQKQNYTL